MSSLKDFILSALNDVEYVIDHHSYYVKRTLNMIGPVVIQAYLGFGNKNKIHINGRLLEEKGTETPNEDDTKWQNFTTMVKRYESDEIPYAKIKASFYGQERIVGTDPEGYFYITFENFELPDNDEIWHEAQIELLDDVNRFDKKVATTAEVLIPKSPQYGLISDVDDTILVSHSADLIKKARLTFLHNAKTRVPFEGVSALYQALFEGNDKQQRNPVFYVSSSPWNLYDLLKNFCEDNDIPKGPFMLRDLGLTSDHLIKSGHGKHKIEQFEKIFETYPDTKFILVGDSGQKDPEIYEKLAENYTDHIKGIYIRDVTDKERDREVMEIADRIKEKGIEMILAKDTQEAARHAAEQGWISQEQVETVAQQVDRDKKNKQ